MSDLNVREVIELFSSLNVTELSYKDKSVELQLKKATLAPGQPEFVQIGKKVNKGETICIVEAMKVMNTIEADVSGEIVEIIAESGAVVEFGSSLIKIRTA